MEAQWKADREAQRLEQEQKDKKEDETKKKDNSSGGGNGKLKQGGYILYPTTYILLFSFNQRLITLLQAKNQM